MKKLFAVILVCALCLATAYAAEWGEGLGPEQPFPGVRRLELDKEMGYSYFYPSAKLSAEGFCDVLEIYLPREDLALGDGHAHLCDDTGEVLDIDFANPDQVELRSLDETELANMHWGGGMCIEMHLPVSLKINQSYYVKMDLNCFNANGGKLSNYDLNKPDQWTPVLTGEYGIDSLYYQAPPAQPTQEELDEMEAEPEDAEPTEAPDEGPVEPKLKPEVGDIIHFDLVLGGPAKTAVMFSENDSASFDEIEVSESGVVKGTVVKPELDWGVVFLDENGDALDVIRPAWVDLSDEPTDEAADAPTDEAADDAADDDGELVDLGL